MNQSKKLVAAARNGYFFISALLCALGLTVLFRPEMPFDRLRLLMGSLMVLFGIVKMAGYFSNDLYRLAFQHDLAYGLGMMALGLLELVRRDQTLDQACLGFGVVVLLDGLLKIQTALDAKRFGLRSWWGVLITALAVGALGVVLLALNRPGLQSGAGLLGGAILAEGLLNWFVALLTVRIIKPEKTRVFGG